MWEAVTTPFLNIKRINHLKQEIVSNIVSAAKEDPMIKRIIVFGSSIRNDCNDNSDIDICIDWTQDCYDEDDVLRPFTINMRKKSHRTLKETLM